MKKLYLVRAFIIVCYIGYLLANAALTVMADRGIVPPNEIEAR